MGLAGESECTTSRAQSSAGGRANQDAAARATVAPRRPGWSRRALFALVAASLLLAACAAPTAWALDFTAPPGVQVPAPSPPLPANSFVPPGLPNLGGTVVDLPTGATELPGLRTMTSRSYVLPGGSEITRLYEGPVNYRNGLRWEPIDNTLVPTSEPGYAYRNRANGYRAELPENLSTPVRFSVGDDSVEMTLEGAQAGGSLANGIDRPGRDLNSRPVRLLSDPALVSGAYPSVVLEAVGVMSYAELSALGSDEVIRRLDERNPPLHPADAFLAVIVLSALSELRETTKSLDAARRGFERATIVLAALGVILTGTGVIVALVSL
jgi:hypothetical protein